MRGEDHQPRAGIVAGVGFGSRRQDASSRQTALAIAIVVVPVSVIGHELGHFLSELAFGFESPTLHYASTGFARESEFWVFVRRGDVAAASAIADVTHAVVSSALGPLTSYALVAAGLWGLARRGAAVFLALAMSSAARFAPVLLLFALGRAEHTDEAHVSRALDVPPAVLVAAAILALLAATIGGAVLTTRRGRGRLVLPTVIGVVIGTVLWMGVLGPIVLP